jgi:hypothetical protein
LEIGNGDLLLVPRGNWGMSTIPGFADAFQDCVEFSNIYFSLHIKIFYDSKFDDHTKGRERQYEKSKMHRPGQ